jgi:hypothetical protein
MRHMGRIFYAVGRIQQIPHLAPLPIFPLQIRYTNIHTTNLTEQFAEELQAS